MRLELRSVASGWPNGAQNVTLHSLCLTSRIGGLTYLWCELGLVLGQGREVVVGVRDVALFHCSPCIASDTSFASYVPYAIPFRYKHCHLFYLYDYFCDQGWALLWALHHPPPMVEGHSIVGSQMGALLGLNLQQLYARSSHQQPAAPSSSQEPASKCIDGAMFIAS